MKTKRENKSPWEAYHQGQADYFRDMRRLAAYDAINARAKALEAERYAKAHTMSDDEAVKLAEEHHEALRALDRAKPQA